MSNLQVMTRTASVRISRISCEMNLSSGDVPKKLRANSGEPHTADNEMSRT